MRIEHKKPRKVVNLESDKNLLADKSFTITMSFKVTKDYYNLILKRKWLV